MSLKNLFFFNFSFLLRWITNESYRILIKEFIKHAEHHRRHFVKTEFQPGDPSYYEATKDVPWMVLWVDGQSTHHDYETMKLLEYHKIALLTFIAHTTHLVQPLDRGFNTSLKVTLT